MQISTTGPQNGGNPAPRMPQFNNAKELWAIIAASPYSRLTNPSAWEALIAQITPLVASCGDKAADTKALVSKILELPFPKDRLGLCDATEYDTYCRSIIEGFHRVIRNQGEEPDVLPATAPQFATLTQIGAAVAVSGSSRAGQARAKEVSSEREQIQAEIKRLDSTDECKKALIKHYGEDRKWKRTKKFNHGSEIARVFKDKNGAMVTVLLDPHADELDEIIRIEEVEAQSPVKGKFTPPVGKGFTGRVLFNFGENQEPEEIDFFCGPEEGRGMSDQHSPITDKVIEEIFSDYEIEVAAAENYHTIVPKAGETVEDLQRVVRTRLEAAGAIFDQ